MVCEILQPKVGRCENRLSLRKKFHSPQASLRKSTSTAKPFRSRLALSAKIFTAAKRPLGTRVPFHSQVHPFRSCKMVVKSPRLEILHFAAETPFHRVFRSCETTLWHTSATSPYARFVAVKWVAKMMPKFPLLRKRPAAAKSTFPRCKKSRLLRKGIVTLGVPFKRYKFHFSYSKSVI